MKVQNSLKYLAKLVDKTAGFGQNGSFGSAAF